VAKARVLGSGIKLKIYFVYSHFNKGLSSIDIDVVETQYYRHAYDYVLSMDIKQYEGIICCSGDGITHEVVNALLNREDREECIQRIAIGVIPVGSSNGIAKTICEESGETFTPQNCAFIIAKGRSRPIDILEIETQSGKKIYSFLSVAYGIISDIDLESERYWIT
jgi:sphingosine kinase